MYLRFAIFYQRFIQDFSTIAAPLTLILKITGLFNKLALIVIGANVNKVVDDNGLKPNLSKSINITKFVKD